MQQSVEELVWRKGPGCERSYKIQALTKEQKEYLRQTHTAQTHTQAPQTQAPQTRINEPITTEGFRQVNTKREEANTKINERYLVGQSTQNPFLSSDYASDIEVQMNFLTPQKS